MGKHNLQEDDYVPLKVKSDYTNMSAYYDMIMTSGYYDYQAIVNDISKRSFSRMLELGCGTGLILQELGRRYPSAKIKGLDHTPAMLSIARDRLQQFQNISLSLQDVTTFQLDERYDLAFSYGGVWYFVIDGDNEPFMVSHLSEEGDNRRGLEQLASHITPGGKLLLGVQGPHHDYERPVSNGMTYKQKIFPSDHGFTKHYHLLDDNQVMMSQVIHYRTYAFQEALGLLKERGFNYQPNGEYHGLFLEFNKSGDENST